MKKSMLYDWALLCSILIISAILLSIFPDRKRTVIDISSNFFIEMILILPAVMVMLGLFEVWVPKNIVVKYIGKASGMKGILLSLTLGALPTGPLYIAFPMAAALIRKGAKISNIVIFLSAWACIKIPQEMVELQFLGLHFMLSRLILTVAFVIIMGLLIEMIMKWRHFEKFNL